MGTHRQQGRPSGKFLAGAIRLLQFLKRSPTHLRLSNDQLADRTAKSRSSVVEYISYLKREGYLTTTVQRMKLKGWKNHRLIVISLKGEVTDG